MRVPAPADDSPASTAGRRKRPLGVSTDRAAGNAGHHLAREDLQNPIDAFIVADLPATESSKPEANRVTLIRRLSLDLVGLPPTVAEVDDFLADQRPNAYDQVVERLLASPHYGERQARHWLDLARYADSNGYTNDNPRPSGSIATG